MSSSLTYSGLAVQPHADLGQFAARPRRMHLRHFAASECGERTANVSFRLRGRAFQTKALLGELASRGNIRQAPTIIDQLRLA